LHDIFISYSHDDVAIARTFAEAFEREGFSVWWDDGLRTGQAWDETIEAALRGAKAVVVLWSVQAVASRWVRAEATIADRKGTLVPVMIEPCQRPIIFELTQTAELSHWRGDGADDAWLNFVADVRGFIGGADDSARVPAPDSRARATSGVPFIALMPILARAGDDDLEMLAEDLTDDITTALAKRTMMKVISSATVAKCRGSTADTLSIGRELGARHMAVGKVQPSSGKVRFTIQIVDTTSGDVTWSEKFVRAAADFDDDLDSFVGMVADLIHQHCYQTEVMRAIQKSEAFSAWDHFLRSTMVYLRFDSQSIASSITEARRGVAESPDFGMAHAQLAASLGNLMGWIGQKTMSAEAEIRRHLRTAIDLDKNNWLTLMFAALGHHGMGEYKAALRLFEQAKRLNGNQTDLDSILTGIYYSLGRYADALAVSGEGTRGAEARFGYRTQTLCAMSCYAMGHLDAADARLERALQLNPYYLIALKWRAIIAAMRNRPEEAAQIVRQMQGAEPDFTLDIHIRQMYYDAPDRAKIDVAVDVLRKIWNTPPSTDTTVA